MIHFPYTTPFSLPSGHNRRWWYGLLISWMLSLAALGALAQNVNSARIEEGATNRLTVIFSEPITVSDASGFRLVGGVARIDQLLSGSGTDALTFSLTDYALPDDAFTLLHWPEMSDARSSSGKLGAIDQAVVNDAMMYKGSGRLYYVSTSGSDSGGDRGSRGKPFKTILAAQNVVEPGDYILLKRGDTFNGFEINKSGSEGNPITFAAYGDDNFSKPLIKEDNETSSQDIGVRATNKDHIVIDNLRIEHIDGGIYVYENSSYLVVSNCTIVGVKKGGRAGVRLVRKSGAEQVFVYPQILNNDVSGCNTGIMLNGFPYDSGAGKGYKVRGGVIENNTTQDHASFETADGITVNRSNFESLVVRKNDIAGYYDDGIDMFAASNLVVEYNSVHNPGTNNVSGVGIKAGGRTGNRDGIQGFRGENVIVRYNTVYNIQNSSGGRLTGITSNKGTSGEIYGNLVYNTGLHGIELDDPLDEWNVYNNTIVNADGNGISIYVSGSLGSTADVSIRNNIADGGSGDSNDIGASLSGAPSVQGSNNVWINNKKANGYSGQNDLTVSASSLFINPSQNDFRLKDGSPAINAGTTSIPPYERDIRGFLVDSNPDIGAYEFGDQFDTIDPPTNGSDNGIAYSYYEGNWTQLPDFSTLTAIKTGTLTNFSLNPAQREDYYGLVYTTYLEVSTAGSYTFYTNSDDGTRLYLDGTLVVDNDGVRAPVEESGSISLSVGRHQLTVEYFEAYGGQLLEVRYAGPGISKQLIPGNLLYLEDNTVPPTASTEVWLETECADNVGSAWEALNDNTASQDSYLKVIPGNSSASSAPTDPNKQLIFNFSVSEAGQYTIYTRQRENGSNTDDSFWVKVNGESWTLEGLGGPANSFYWEATNQSYNLSAGNHTLTIGTREDNTQLDKIYITLNGNAPSGEGEVASNCNSQPPPPSNPVVTANAGQDRTVSVNVSQPYQIRGGASGPNPFRRYLWEKVSGPSLTLNGNSANAKLSNLRVGTYVLRFTATDSEGNSGSDEMTLTVTGSNARTASGAKDQTSVTDVREEVATLSAYPNPTSKHLTVRLPTHSGQSGILWLTDLAGKQVWGDAPQTLLGGDQLQLDLRNVPAGIYLLRWQADRLYTTKVLIER